MTSAPTLPAARWDVFCRVIDNHGDLGVCWRLCRQLADRGAQVRLWVDDARALAWMAPAGHPGVQVLPWHDPLADEVPGDVVIEAFGCDPPAAFLARMAAVAASGRRAPVWINLEYLSAEAYVERSHGLASPQWSGPAAGLTKWFFYPGFTPATGGLLRDINPLGPLTGPDATPAGDRAAALVDQGLTAQDGERLILLFGYAQPALPAWLAGLQNAPGGARSQVLVTPGHSTRAVQAWLASDGVAQDFRADIVRGALRLTPLPHRDQRRFDALLRLTDLNLVRGEDSLVSALWAGRPLLWQLYPQDDGAHAAKLDAFLALYLADAPADLAAPLRRLMQAWNGLRGWDADAWHALWGPRYPDWCTWAAASRPPRATSPGLVSQLFDFVSRKLN